MEYRGAGWTGQCSEAYIVVISLWAGLGLPLQDMRDQVGDRIMGRKNAAAFRGRHHCENTAERVLFPVLPAGLFLHPAYPNGRGEEIFASRLLTSIVIEEVLWHWAVALRLWLYKSPKADDKTYHWFVYLFIVTIPMICFI